MQKAFHSTFKHFATPDGKVTDSAGTCQQGNDSWYAVRKTEILIS